MYRRQVDELADKYTDKIRREVEESRQVKADLLGDAALLEQFSQVIEACIDASRRGNRLFFAGNGGSAADAQHLAAEFVNRYAFGRPGLPAMALTTDEEIFARQLEANGVEGDVFIGISTSGNSRNILSAMRRAGTMGITTIGLTGRDGGQLRACCDYCIRIPSNSTPRVQEVHILLGHILCGMVEHALFADKDQ